MLIKKKKIIPPELTTEKLKEYIKDRILFRKEQFVMEPSIEAPQGGLFGNLCQEWQIKYIFEPLDLRDENGLPQYKLLYYQMPKKALWIETPIMTPKGWKLLKDIKEGDFVFDEKGNPIKVLYVTDIMYNHQCYEIIFSDNTKIIADEGHLWTVWDFFTIQSYRSYDKNHNKNSNTNWPENWYCWESKNRSKTKHLKVNKNGIKNLTTEELSKNIKINNKYNYTIPSCKALNYENKDLPIDPWCLGYLLGDGDSVGGGRVACDPRDKNWLKIKFKNRGFLLSKYKDFSKYEFIINDISIKWKNLNLYKNKHIPDIYLYSSIEQRLELLKGLIDSDGSVDREGGYNFFNTNKQLFDNVIQLSRSLGYIPKVYKHKRNLNGKKCKDCYQLRIMSKTPLVTSPRKLDMLGNFKFNNRFNTSRRIISVEKIPSVPVKCIKVDSISNLFLAGEGMIPTHNSGKTALLAGEIIVQLLLSPYPTEENYIIAGDKDQAAYVLKKTKAFIERNPNFVDLFKTYKNEIIVESTGAMVQVLSSDADTKSGKSPDWFLADELWVQPHRDLWDMMFNGMAAKPHAQAIALTNAGFDKKSICYEVRELCKSGEFKNFYWFEPTGSFLESLSMPWITEQWLEIERKSMPIKVFNRFRRNLWVDEGQNPFMPDEGWNCFKSHLLEKSICYNGPHYVGIDLGLKKDAASLTIVHRDGKKLVVDAFRRWLGSIENPVNISEIESELILILRNFNNCILVCDPWQMMGTIQRFRSVGIEVIEFYLTTENVTKLSKNLFYLFKNQSIDIPKYSKFEDELKGLQVIEKSYGWRIDHSQDTTSDITMGLGMASLTAMERGINEYSGKDLADLGFLNQSAIYKAGSSRTFKEDQIIINNNLKKEESFSGGKIHSFIKRIF